MHTTGFDFDVITGPSIPRNIGEVVENADTKADSETVEHASGDEGDRQR